jgi:hypothetical protein
MILNYFIFSLTKDVFYNATNDMQINDASYNYCYHMMA